MNKNDPFFISSEINLSHNDSASWVESSFNNGKSGFDRKNNEFLSLSLSKIKLLLLLFIIIFGLAVLLGRSFYLQVIKNDYYSNLADNNRLRIKYSKAQRGIIFDRNGEVMVQNVFGFSLFITQADLPRKQEERDIVLDNISQITGLAKNEIKQKLLDNHDYYWQPVVIKTGIGYDQAMILKIASVDFSGVSLEEDNWRHYVYSTSTAHLMGYVGKINAQEYEEKKDHYLLSDNIGKTGLEKYYENYLKGSHGEKRVEVDSLGKEKKVVSEFTSVSGSSLILTVDVKLQNYIQEILEEKLESKKAATVIVSNPQNGEILALVNYPGYNNNLFAVGIGVDDYQSLLDNELKPLFFRAIAGEYPSGSTVKQIVAAAALEEGIVDRNTSFNSVGGLWINNLWFFPDWRAGGHGITNIIKAIADSVNTYFYYVGGGYGDFDGLGLDRLVKYMRLFGLGEKLEIDLPGEKTGLVPTSEWKEEVKNEVWYIGDTYHISIGQGDLLVTPLQVNSYTSTIANGGTIYQPHLVREVIHDGGRKELIIPEVIREGFVSESNINIVREGMRETVRSGSARSLYTLPVEVAGKTGTAQWNSNKENHAWFTAFAPYNNPNFCITILVEEGGEGSSIAVPIARDVINYWFTR